MQNKQSEIVFEIDKVNQFDPSCEEGAGFISKIFFFWTNKLMRRGAKKPLEMNDLFDVNKQEHPKYAYDKFQKIYNEKSAQGQVTTFTILRAFLTWSFVASASYGIIANVLQFSGPLMINEILIFLEDPSVPNHMGYIWASILVVCFLLRTIILQHAFHLINKATVQMMNSMTSKVYFKILKLSSASRKFLQTGSIMNYINVDIQALNICVQMSNFIFTAPVMVVLAIYLIIREVGWIGMSSPVIMLVGVFIQQKLMKIAFGMRKDQLFWTDKRSKCVTEYFGGIRIVKYYGWEDIVARKIEAIRSEEVNIIFKGLMIRTFVEVTMNMMPIMASILCFGMYVYFFGSESLTPAKAYTVLSLFNLMANPMRMLVMSLIQFANAQASMARLEHFFSYFETRNEGVTLDDKSIEVGEIQINNGKFRWETEEAKQHFEEGKKLMTKTPADKKKLEQKKKQLEEDQKNEKKNKRKIKYKEEKYSKKKDEENRESKASLLTQNTIREPLLGDEENPFEDQKRDDNQIDTQENNDASVPTKKEEKQQLSEESKQEPTEKSDNSNEEQKAEKAPTAVKEVSLVQQKAEDNNEQLPDNDEQHGDLSLQIDDLTIKQAELMVVIGRVGSGKSTFLSAILNEVDLVEGTVKRRGTVAYIPQISWLRSATIRENIVFEGEYKEEWYQEVVRLCELQSDFEIFGGGDLTQVGEKGVNLSGGQKQRISIARALYADADIYLIDDCLSALDSYVAKKIFSNVIKGALKRKTVIFVTHSIQFVSQCDTIIVMNGGKIAEKGTHAELMENPNSLFKNLESQLRQQSENQEAKEMEEQKMQETKNKSAGSIDADKKLKKEEKGQALVKVEERTKGKVPWSVYYRFFTGAGGLLTFLMFFFITLGQAARVGSDWWVGSWSSNVFDLPETTYIWVYACISILVGVLILLKGFFFGKFIIKSAQYLQRQLIQTLLKTPLSWFDVTPTGRIISRTTKDQDDLDSSLAFNVQMTVQNLLMMFSSIIVVGVITPMYFAFAAVCLVVYYFTIKYYMLTSVELKRLEANTRAPLISHIQETINGIYVIRAFNKGDNFINKFFRRQKEYIIAFNNQNYANRWISLLTDLFAVTVIGGSAYFGILSRGKTSANLIGLSLSWSLQISTILSFTLKLMADTESNMNAVIRLLDYIDNNPAERSFSQSKAPEQWPSTGKYKMSNLTYRYRPDLEDVIHGISFDVESKAKIGVVGRTGSGKSTLTLGLLRILELSLNPQGALGKIQLDGVDTSQLGLHELRHRVTIIPQDPVLFSGTFKDNVDPFDIYTDEEIATCLKKVDMWDQIKPNKDELSDIKKKVYGVVDDSGSNYSVGQRQLVCMARALIRKPKVLLMDEATASIDEKTDALLQKMIRKEFKETTVITIAHRLNTIIHYDKILVLDYGNIKEYSTPRELIMNEESFLGNLIKETGKQYQDRMMNLLNNPSEEE